MPAVEVDVTTIPDIIEAQLTLSYGRLSDLIRVIVEQGNNNAEDIEDLRDQLQRLSSENTTLREEIDRLKEEKGNEMILESLAQLKADVEQLHVASESQAEQLTASETARETGEKTLKERLTELAAHTTAAQQRLADNVEGQLENIHISIGGLRAFVGLWGTEPAELREKGRSDPEDPTQMEHSLQDRTQYLHSLPAFAELFDELNVVRAQIRQQAADALAAKTSVISTNNSQMVKETTASSDALQKLQQRMQELEEALHHVKNTTSRGSEAAAAPVTQVQNNNFEVELVSVYERLGRLEERLQALLLTPPSAESAEASGEMVPNAGLVDLVLRVAALEETVEGLPPSYPAPAAAAPVPQTSVPEPTAATPVESDGGEDSRPASQARGRPPSGRGSLPPIRRDSAVRTGTGSAVTSPFARPSSSSPKRVSITPGVEQPNVEALRRDGSLDGAGVRRISVAVEPDDGLRKRVGQLEENVAILEVNKADKAELKRLEEALRGLLARGGQGTMQSSPLVPQRPASSGARAFGSGAEAIAAADYGRASLYENGSCSRPGSSCVGRPMFVGSSSVYLRDGARLTSATVSATSPFRNTN